MARPAETGALRGSRRPPTDARRGRRAGAVAAAMILMLLPAAGAIEEHAFEAEFQARAWPYYQEGRFGTFVGAGGVRIAYAAFEEPDAYGVLVLLPGKSESYLKYAELIYDLRDSGYSIYALDHRGMGFSERLLTDDPDKVHVERFEDYVEDLRIFLETIVPAHPQARHVLLGHSLGGAVAVRYLQTHPGGIDAAILCAPMLDVLTDELPEWLADALSRAAVLTGAGEHYCPDYGPWEAGRFAANTMTSSEARWARWNRHAIPDEPRLESGGPTYRWLRESLAATRRARREAGVITIPVLMLQAGRDARVEPRGQDEACARMGDCTRVRFPEARHEILMERDRIRDRALAEIRAFLERLRR
jgi:lysophospholipase